MLKRMGLAVKLVITILIVYEICNTIQTSFVSESIKKASVSQYEDECIKLTDTYSMLIDSTLRQYSKMLDVYVSSVPEGVSDSVDVLDWFQYMCEIKDSDFDYVAFVDEKGEFYGNNGSRTNVTDRDYYKAIMQRGADAYTSGAAISKTTGKNILHLCRAVKVDGKNVGFFTGILQVAKMEDLIQKLVLGETGVAIVADVDNMLIATSGDNEKILGMISDSAVEPKIHEMEQRVSRGEHGSCWLHLPSKKKDIFNVYYPVGSTGWKIYFMIEKDQVYRSANAVARICVIAGILVGIVLMVILRFYIHRQIKPLKVLDVSLGEIAGGDADLTQRIMVKNKVKTEIHSVVDSFNMFIGKMQDMMRSLKQSKEELNSTGSLLSQSTESTSAAITQITANINNLGSNIDSQTQSVEETSGAINRISSNIQSMNKMIVTQSSCITEASAAIEEMIGNIASVNRSMEKMASSFSSLQEKSNVGVQKQKHVNERIKLIEAESQTLQQANTVISSIASQTNLLAMNAAIEAAHAGESGKGFSVVADEIRKLSETSSTQSKTIGLQLKKIVASISGIVDASAEAETAFADVSDNLSSTNSIVTEIHNAMEEQTLGSQQITEALRLMTDGSSEVTNASTEMAEGARAILDEVRNLQENTQLMKGAMDEMAIGTKRINETGAMLHDLSATVRESIDVIGKQVDKFTV